MTGTGSDTNCLPNSFYGTSQPLHHKRRAIPPPRRGIPKLSDHTGGKIAVICKKYGMRKRCDADAMTDRIGDIAMPILPFEIANRWTALFRSLKIGDGGADFAD